MSIGVLKVYTNSDLEFGLRWKDENGDPYELSAGRAQIRAVDNDDGDPLVDMTADLTDPTIARFVATVADVSALAEGSAIYDVVLTRASDGRVKTVVRSDVVIQKGVTR